MTDNNIINSDIDKSVKFWKNVVIKDSIILHNSSIGDDTSIIKSEISSNVAINRRNYINNSIISSYTYTGLNNNIGYAQIGKFCSLGRSINVGGVDHNYKKTSLMPLSRFAQLNKDTVVCRNNVNFKKCEVGNDVWIGDGACILSKGSIGDGAVIGAGAVVVDKIPAYAIAVGVPAKVIGYRFDDQYIQKMLKIRWCNWPDKVIIVNVDLIFNTEMSQTVIDELERIKSLI